MPEPALRTPRALCRALFEAAVKTALPARIVPGNLPSPPKGRTLVVGAGKASAAMARALEAVWEGPLSGLVITRYGHEVACRKIRVLGAGHPVPDAAGQAGSAEILALAQGLGPDDLMIALISGGGSALLSLPVSGVSLRDKQALNTALLRSGQPIGAMNTLRKHLSAIKGGRLALAAYPARCETLAISDVPGDDPATIASGPTLGDASTLAQAREILRPLATQLPQTLMAALKNPANETPFPDDPRLADSHARIIAAPMMSLAAAADLARANGYQAIILGDAIEGDAEVVARDMAKTALAMQKRQRRVALISGGETTVTPRGHGSGGRNVQFLMALAKALKGAPGIVALAADTDGVDGSAEIAGALIDPDTPARAETLGYPLAAALAANDGHGFFARLDDQVVTGPTLTNVNDFRVILITP